MQVEYKTEKGTVLFVKVPDDLISFKLIEDMGDDVLEIKSEVKGYNSLTQRWKNIRVSSGFKIIGLASEIIEEQANMMVDSINYGYASYGTNNEFQEQWALDSFKSLMQHLKVYEVNPHKDDYFGTHGEWMDKQFKIEEAQSRTGKWIVLFKPKDQ